MKWSWGIVLLLAGCSQGAKQQAVTKEAALPVTAQPPKLETSKDPVAKLQSELRSAAVQLDPAVGKIEEAFESAQKIKGDTNSKAVQDAMTDVCDFLDSAGESLSHFTEAPPENIQVFRAHLTDHENQKKLLDAAITDALQDITEARDIVDSVAQDASGKDQNPLEAVVGPLDEVVATLHDLVSELGIKLPVDAADSGDTETEKV